MPLLSNSQSVQKRPRALCPGRRKWVAFVWIAVWSLSGTAQPVMPDFERQLEGDINMCLPVRGPATDPTPWLRLAPAPMSGNVGGAPAVFYRLLGGSSGAPLSLGPMGETRPAISALVDGGIALKAGRSEDADRQFVACGQAAAQVQDLLLQAACANNLGLAYAARGRFDAARKELERAIDLYRGPHPLPTDLVDRLMAQQASVQRSSADMAAQLAARQRTMPADRMADFLGRLDPGDREEVQRRVKEELAKVDATIAAARPQPAPDARSAYARQMNETMFRPMDQYDTQRGLERTRLNLGNLALAGGRLADAENQLREVWEQRPAGEPAGCSAAAAIDFARLQRRLGHTADADVTLARSRQEVTRNAEVVSMVEPDAIRVASVETANSGTMATGGVQATQQPADPSKPRMLTSAESTALLTSYAETTGRFNDNALAELRAQATSQGETDTAVTSWRRLALRADAGGRPDFSFAAHAALARLAARRGDAATAIFEGKRAANLVQSVRVALDDHTPTREARRAFLRERQQVYVTLAQALLDADRLREAESVLQLLKEDEGQQFVDRPSGLGTVALTGAEQAAQREDDASITQLRAAEQARIGAAARLPAGANLLRAFDIAQLERFRLRFGLTLLDLPERLRREPPRIQGATELSQRIVADTRDFFLGQGHRLDRSLDHLLEDLPAFTSQASAADRDRLMQTLRAAPRLRSDLAPLLADIPVDAEIRITMRRAGTPKSSDEEAPKVFDYSAAEIIETMWRSVRQADRIEALASERSGTPRGGDAPAAAANQDAGLALLARQPVPTALLYYLPSADRVDALVVSAAGRRHVRLASPAAELDRALAAFSSALRDDRRDPTPAANAAYRLLFAPVESVVAESGAKLLALSLAGRLRWVPFAALHDGKGWLVERYAFAVHPGGALEGRLKPATPNWRVEAFGASAGGAGFGPLGSVRAEVDGIVRHGAAGVLPGEAWLDGAFTADRLHTALESGAQLLHIASHFKFAEGDAAGSYLLLGDGSTLSLRELTSPRFRFDRTELVTLSACETGVSSDDAYGQEVDGLAALLMGQGAPSVLASLWQVNDLSTAVLMSTLYRQREDGRLSRAAALRQAQLAMIQSGGTGDAGTNRGVTRVREPGDAAPVDREGTARLGTAHPFHWAAFVLMGDWL